MALLIVIIVLVVVGGWVAVTFNSLIKLRTRTNEAWSDIDVQLKRRHNLIPSLVETVMGYAKHEEGVFTKVTEARARAIEAKNPKEAAEAENALKDTLKSLFAVAENYPELKANENFMHLQEELSDTEDKIQASRRFYNGNVRDLNTKIQVFPANVVASMFGFKKREFYEVGAEEERKMPEVKF